MAAFGTAVGEAGGRAMIEMILDAKPDTVRMARRFAKTSLTGQDEDLVADVELVIAELVSNAALHGQPPVLISLAVDQGGCGSRWKTPAESCPWRYFSATMA